MILDPKLDPRVNPMKVVDQAQFNTFVAAYPEKLAFAEYKAFDVYQDPKRGRWPMNVIAICEREGDKTTYSVLDSPS